MDEKTEELREIFTSVTDEETVTETQEESRGSLEQDERTVEERLASVVEQLKDRYGFESPLSTDELIAVAEGFYDGDTDAEIAGDLGIDEAEVFEARLSMHLIRADDADGVDLVTVRKIEDDEELAESLDVSTERVERYRRVAAAYDESRAANDRYRDEFDTILGDADLVERMATDVREDGLEDATEGMETDVSF